MDDQGNATRRDVAEKAGVSEATVSRVFNNPEKVGELKRNRVLHAAKELSYVPNFKAANLRRGTSGDLLLLEYHPVSSYSWSDEPMYSWFYGNIVRSAAESLTKTRFNLRFSRLSSNEELPAALSSAEGIVLMNSENESLVQDILETGIPSVFCHHKERIPGAHTVYSDNAAGSGLLGIHLREQGFSRALYVQSEEEVYSHQLRFKGFCQGFDQDCELIYTGVTMDAAEQDAAEIITQMKKIQADVLVCMNDMTALSIIRYALKAGLVIGKDLYVTGYDALPLGAVLPFTFPSIDGKISQVYSEAFQILQSLISSQDVPNEIPIKPILMNGFDQV
jgi:DNA-binding LacI/PurR family transcriptional regulator